MGQGGWKFSLLHLRVVAVPSNPHLFLSHVSTDLCIQRLDELKGTLRGDHFQCLQDHFDWNKAERNPTIHSMESKHSQSPMSQHLNTWTVTDSSTFCWRRWGFLSSRSETQQLRDIVLFFWGHWHSPPEEQRLSCSYPCLKIERDKDRAWVPTAFLNRHWVTSEVCGLLQGKGLSGRSSWEQGQESKLFERWRSCCWGNLLWVKLHSHPHPMYT